MILSFLSCNWHLIEVIWPLLIYKVIYYVYTTYNLNFDSTILHIAKSYMISLCFVNTGIADLIDVLLKIYII